MTIITERKKLDVGDKPPLSCAFTSAPLSNRNSATSKLLYPAAKRTKSIQSCHMNENSNLLWDEFGMSLESDSD